MLNKIGFACSVASIVFGTTMAIKANVTCKKRNEIDDAIHKYFVDCTYHNKEVLVDYDDTESFHKTLWRLYDWGHKRILPKDKYEIIKPYIERR